MARIALATTSADVDAAMDLAEATWGSRPITDPMLRALEFAGSYVALATDDNDDLVGMCVGFVGIHDRASDDHASGSHDVHLHSHLAAVRADARGLGIGRALKWHQRTWCLDRGIETVTWTFDPLVRVNARFNLHHLGAVGDRYLVDLYGVMDDDINRGQPSDRILVRWDLRGARAMATSSAALPAEDATRLRAAGAGEAIVDDDGRPRARAVDATTRLVATPTDIATLRVQDPAAASAWRVAVRSAMVDAFAAGLTPVALTHDGDYVFAPESP